MPCTGIGVILAVPVLLAGGKARRAGPAIEVYLHEGSARAGGAYRRLPFSAITFGHVIIGIGSSELDCLRAHELVHVRQYEWLGPLFLALYPLASLVALVRGKGIHAGNYFEVQANAISTRARNAA